MKNQPENNQARNEENFQGVDIKTALQLLWKRKWLILAIIVMAAGAAFVFTLLTTDVHYEARSEVLLMPPRYTEIEMSQILPETYHKLALSDDIINRMIKKVQITDEEGGLVNPSDIEENLSVNVLVEPNGGGSDTALLFRLSVVRTDPEEASLMANTWADLFREDTLDIRRAEVEEIFELTKRRFAESETRLFEAQERRQEIKEKGRLEQLRFQLDSYRENFLETEKDLLSLRKERGLKETEHQHVIYVLEQMETDEGYWLGDRTLNERLSYEDIERRIGHNDMQQVVANYFEIRKDLYKFRQQHDLEAKRNELDSLVDLLKEMRHLQAEHQEELAAADAEYEQVLAVLDEEPDRWELARSLSRDVFWENIFSPEEIHLLSELVLKEEEVNPVYEELRQKKAHLEVSLDSLPSKLNYYEERIEVIQEKEENLRLEIDQLEEAKEDLVGDLELRKELYQDWRDRFRYMSREVTDLDLDLEEMEQQIVYLENRRDELKSEVQGMEDRLWSFELEKENIDRDIKSYETTYERLSERIEEARLARAEQSSDVRFISEAVPPGRIIGRGTKINVLIAVFMAAMLGVFGVFVHDIIMKEE